MRTETQNAPSLPRRVFGVALDDRTHRNLAYLFLRFPLGIAYFTLFFTGLVVGIALVPFVIGVPILLGVLGAGNYAGAIEARVARALLDVDVDWHPTDATDLSLVAYLKTVGTDRRNYALVAYFLAQFVVGTVLFVVLTVGIVVPVTLVVAPLVYWLPGVQYRLLGGDGSTISLGPLTVNSTVPRSLDLVVIDTLPEALVASAVGVVALLVALHVFNMLARGLGHLTSLLLGD